ncbi:hypothetical protein BDV95DRAFT_523367, partial [Massariosphaeria phaeospora]
MPPIPFFALGCLSGATSVALGAFGAHGLKKHISDPAKLANWNTAAQYQLIHSLALSFAATLHPTPTLALSLFSAGITLFSGSLYVLVLDAQKRWGWVAGPATPVGGLCLMGGWVVLGL